MQSAWGTDIPVRAEDFPGPVALRKQLRRCRCGQLTFLSLPCRNCGAQKSEPAFRFALRKARRRRAGRWVIAAAYLLAAGGAALLIWPPLAVLPAVVTLAALVSDIVRSTKDGDICFWLFHDSAKGKKKLPMANAACIEALTDAYDADLRRLEQMIALDPSTECAERVFYMAQDMTRLFHNRRVSALLAKCLTALPVSEGICVDLDQVCAWLEPEELSPAALAKLADCARFTCLPAGGPTGRFVGRFCAFQVQKALEESGLIHSYCAGDIPDLSSMIRKILPAETRVALSALWNIAAVYAEPRTAPEDTAPKYSDDIKLNKLPPGSRFIADYWFQNAWYNPDSKAFREMDKLFRNRLGTVLSKKWRKGQREHAH